MDRPSLPFAPPNLLLHSIGAKTGAAGRIRSPTPRDGDDYLIVASNAGANGYPAWYHNLKANPEVEINVGPQAISGHSARRGTRRCRLRPTLRIADENNSGRYTAYQKKTTRPIPVIVLTPA